MLGLKQGARPDNSRRDIAQACQGLIGDREAGQEISPACAPPISARASPVPRLSERMLGLAFGETTVSLLHEPPSNHGINRTSWTMPLMCQVLKNNGHEIGPALVSKMIRAAGYKWRKAKVVLTSNDPTYTEKLAQIRCILSNLQSDEAFFSIDEYGPFAIKTKPGRTLAPPGVQPTVPQWQKSRGCMIMTAALELSGNQVTHFYSTKKNTGEIIRMMDVLIDGYAGHRKLYLSWDAASWHISKQLYTRIEAHNSAVANGGGPPIETAPLPAGAQFLNVIESVFSGMARAIIHGSDYKSVDEAKTAIDRYFAERNGGEGRLIEGIIHHAAEVIRVGACKNIRIGDHDHPFPRVMSEEPCRQGHGRTERLERARGQGDDQTPDETFGDLGQLVCDRLEMPVRLEWDSWPHDTKGEFRKRHQIMCKQRLQDDVGTWVRTYRYGQIVTFHRLRPACRHPAALGARRQERARRRPSGVFAVRHKRRE